MKMKKSELEQMIQEGIQEVVGQMIQEADFYSEEVFGGREATESYLEMLLNIKSIIENMKAEAEGNYTRISVAMGDIYSRKLRAAEELIAFVKMHMK